MVKNLLKKLYIISWNLFIQVSGEVEKEKLAALGSRNKLKSMSESRFVYKYYLYHWSI